MLLIEGSARSMGISVKGLTAMATSKRFKKASEGVDVNKTYYG